ncbi:Signal transduction histidine kinase [gamma proteobacterium HdN1]|nr:Signal transduction histidine kinase [gamma proteobacterium HdN1]
MLNWLRTASIKSKVIFTTLLSLAAVGVILYGFYGYFRQVDESLVTIEAVDLPVVRMANDARIRMSDAVHVFEAVIVERDPDTFAEALEKIRRLREKIVEIGDYSPSLAERSRSLLAAFDAYADAMRSYADDVIEGRLVDDDMYQRFSDVRLKRETAELKILQLEQDISKNFSGTLGQLRTEASATFKNQFTYGILLILIILLVIIAFFRTINGAITRTIEVAGEVAGGKLDTNLNFITAKEFQQLFGALAIMRNRLQEQYQATQLRQIRQTRMATLYEVLRGEMELTELGTKILNCLAQQLGILGGALHVLEGVELVMYASYARASLSVQQPRCRLGETLVGQCALSAERKLIANIPENYAPAVSGLGMAAPRSLLLIPLILSHRVLGVLELLSFHDFTEEDLDFLAQGEEGIAIALHSTLSRLQLAMALDRTREQAETLEQQQEELRVTNEELEEQASILRASEESLQAQQEELRAVNEELENRNVVLDRQKDEIIQNNEALERSRKELQDKAYELEMSNRYKSEFLSTMSHELRTPLNSILILSQGLMENRQQNLLDKQVEHARVIHSSGRDLLMLINDILDLSKVEEGKFELLVDQVNLADLSKELHAMFDSQAEHKKLEFIVNLDERLPETVVMDEHRLNQILRNFISNALKFTHTGRVEVNIRVPEALVKFGEQWLAPPEAISFSVRDTGIGISKDKQALVFEAFQQVDGTISRKYGGTGLGLTISRKLAKLMGGGISVASEGENKGSEFTLVLPRRSANAVLAEQEPLQETLSPKGPPAVLQASTPVEMPTRAQKRDAQKITQVDVPIAPAPAPEVQKPAPFAGLLIIEDHPEFSTVLKDLATEFGFEAACVHSAAAAHRYLERWTPASIVLDLGLPDSPGEELLSWLKAQPHTAQIPVHVISGKENVVMDELAGASEFIAKPFGRDRMERLFNDIGAELSVVSAGCVLIIEDDEVQRDLIEVSFREQEIACDLASSAVEAREYLAAMEQTPARHYGAMVVDLDLPDCDGFQLVDELHQSTNGSIPIIVYTARDLTRQQDADLRRFATRIVLKTDRSIQRLLNETRLFLHWLKGGERDPKQLLPKVVESSQEKLEGQRVLLVDDDIRNLYSLSAVLEDSGWEVRTAANGREALDILSSEGAFDLVLMDIMMPEMDGFEAMRRIRGQAAFEKMPIIALTAKAMRDDRAQCVAAGANDYLSKPVDPSKLKAIVKMWLLKK